MNGGVKKEFLCIGLIMDDILLKGVDHLPANWEETVLATDFKEDVGGGAANSARTLGKLGGSVKIAGMVGNDAAGKRVRESLRQDGVDTSYLMVSDNASTGTAVGLIANDGRRCFVTVRSCNAVMKRDDLKEAEKEDYHIVHINGFFQFPSLEKGFPQMLSKFRSRGSLVSFDMASSDPSGRWMEAILPFADQIDYFFTNEYQLQRLTQKEDTDESVQVLFETGVRNIVVKKGKDGCTIYDCKKDIISIKGYQVEAVDTTGAGDSFDAAFIMGIANGWDNQSCGRFANVVAGLNCCRLGAVAGVPDYDTALKCMNDYYEIEQERWVN